MISGVLVERIENKVLFEKTSSGRIVFAFSLLEVIDDIIVVRRGGKEGSRTAFITSKVVWIGKLGTYVTTYVVLDGTP